MKAVYSEKVNIIFSDVTKFKLNVPKSRCREMWGRFLVYYRSSRDWEI
jgi:hypothetical protein